MPQLDSWCSRVPTLSKLAMRLRNVKSVDDEKLEDIIISPTAEFTVRKGIFAFEEKTESMDIQLPEPYQYDPVEEILLVESDSESNQSIR